MNLWNVYHSIVKTGGATYNIATGELNPSSGYGVAQKGFEKTFPFFPSLSFFSQQIKSYLTSEILEQINNRTDLYVGFWVYKGKIYLDIVEIIPYLETAIREGRRNEQKAIRDFGENKDIFLEIPQVSNDPDLEFDKKY